MKKKNEEKFPHFRWYHPGKHPALIVGEKTSEEYNFRKVMHGEKDGRHLNEKVDPNPNINDSKPMYIGKRIRHDYKKRFSSWKYNWKYNKK